MIQVELVKKVRANINQKEVQKVAQAVSKKIKITDDLEVSLAIVGDKLIRKLNQQYRHRDYVTDVLSFSADQKDFILPREARYLGEIVISYPQTRRQAKFNRGVVKNEFFFLLVHGLLHLLGYDHEQSKKEAKRMENLQQEIMLKLGFKNNLRYN
jgi:probable rRNA maturation factor